MSGIEWCREITLTLTLFEPAFSQPAAAEALRSGGGYYGYGACSGGCCCCRGGHGCGCGCGGCGGGCLV